MPFILAVAFFAYLALCGRAWLSAFRVNLGHTRSWLIAPTLGMAVNTLAIVIFSQAGLPVGKFAVPLFATLLVASLAVVFWRRAPLRGIGIFAFLALAGLLIGAWPLITHGYNWIGSGNDDMTNYCLAAQRLLHNGFYRPPTFTDLSGGDYSQFYWFIEVAMVNRTGSEMLLAGVAGVIGRPPIEIFMPVIYALAMAQMWTLAALVLSRPRRRILAILACVLLIVAPIWNYGNLQQLIAQVGGIALLLATITLAARARFPRGWSGATRSAVTIALPAAAVSVFYPEVIPFLCLGVAVHASVLIMRRRKLIPGQLLVATLSVAALLLILRHNAFSTFTTVLGQTAGGFVAEDISKTIFPYFLMPKGASFLFGLEPVFTAWPEPYGSIGIGAGLALLTLIALAAARGAWRARPASCLLVVMLGVGVVLFRGNNGFGLFKLAMFMIPLLLVEIAGWLAKWRHGPARLAICVLACGGWFYVAQKYVRTTVPARNNVFAEVGHPAYLEGPAPRGDAPVLADVASSPVAKILADRAGKTPVLFLSQPFFSRLAGLGGIYDPPSWIWKYTPHPETPVLTEQLRTYLTTKVFPSQRAFGTRFWPTPNPFPAAADTLFTSQAELLSYNKLWLPRPAPEHLFLQRPLGGLRNYLVFISSEAGQHYYLGVPGLVAAYKPQADFYNRGESFFAIGRQLVFQVINPSPTVRLRISLTDSILGLGRTRLPTDAVVRGTGSSSAPVGFIGSGSANVYSEPIEPLWIDGRAYVALDLVRLPANYGLVMLDGLNGLFNTAVRPDPRLLNGYCRDISLISEDAYQKLARPTQLSHFPADLIQRAEQEYSGVYEDGWVSREAFVTLGAAAAGQTIVVKGLLPQLPGGTMTKNRLEIRLNGLPGLDTVLPIGEFELRVPVTVAANRVRLDLRFSDDAPLPSTDQRPIAALLTSIAVQ